MASAEKPLTAAQKARIEKNKATALQLRKSKVTKRSHEKGNNSDVESKVKRAAVEIDTGAGFFLEEPDGVVASSKTEKNSDLKVVHEPGPVVEVDNLFCLECDKEFLDSYLYSKFDHPVCDKCRDEDSDSLITKTDAKTTYLLKDEDFDKREPELKYIVRKNPHNSHWGDMKLFLHCQVHKRAMEVWGSEEKLEEAKTQRVENREKAKQKKFNKKLKELRMSVRSSLWRKDLTGHQHEYDEEVYDEEEDSYSKTCTTCGHVWTYEKM
ncbi:DNA repair protein complementing XP-A cells homolog [Aplysia californica]|uniref:DNA repair protein complementing XP-A cells homolog n=1 Tax=Aplysia californica TaxID=6500 RepID=A0ABM0JTI3_APLCA|nr:DNA repair protein complementing XP-A cells homolog [Aplysia californica]XP_005101115.1 DNA repair protein complementing XP-A cells homolog [Aplysia californica]XP_035826344.1 DNA repair protein complementing XP-A cells homolog [Aplysia californica]